MGGGATLPTKRGGGARVISSGKRQDLTYRGFTALNLANEDFEQSLFSGAVFEKCRFKSVSFDRCDFAGTTFVSCYFDQCTFVPAELRSCFIVDCEFLDCNFEGSQWDRTQVEKTRFDRSSFLGASIREATFSNSVFSSCGLAKSSVTLDRFDSCRFERTDFADCTALFLFFDGCDFSASKMNAETLGFTFGMVNKNLIELDLIHLGKPAQKPSNDDLVDSLIATYRNRKWYIGAAALQLNFSRVAPVVVIRDLIAHLRHQLKKGRPDWDEFQFFGGVMQRLAGYGRLPLLGLWSFIGLVQAAREQMNREFPSAKGHAPGPELVMGQLNSLLDSQLDTVAGFFDTPTASSRRLLFRWTLTDPPPCTVDRLVPWSVFKTFGKMDAELIKAAPGSWIETWQLSLGALAAIQITLSCVTGITTQLVKIGTNVKKLAHLLPPDRPKMTANRQASALTKASTELLVGENARRGHSYARHELLSPDRLSVIDSVLGRLNNMSDEELTSFLAYDGQHTQAIELDSTKRHQTHAWRSSTSAKRAKPPSPASSKRKRLTRKAKP